MSDQKEWKGQRIGPYRIGERYPGVAEDEGQLHEAHHVETGAPALAVMPPGDEDWRLRTPWSLRTTNYPEPGVLVVDAEPGAGAPTPATHELALGAIRTAGALASLDASEATPFARKSPPTRARHRGLRWALAGVGLVLAAGLTLTRWPGTLKSTTSPSVQTDDEPVSYSDGTFTAPSITYPMPEKPFKDQRKPPCLEGTETELRGGCWLELAKTTPCPRSTAEYQGKCYMPTREVPVPRSAEP
jgi:hypothetical protein